MANQRVSVHALPAFSGCLDLCLLASSETDSRSVLQTWAACKNLS